MQIDVLKNARRNISYGVVNRFIVLACPFVERIFIHNILGAEYLGLGSLFSSIITVLSLTEMGFSGAMVYNMYKPAGEGDTARMNALLNYYRRVYRLIGLIILCVGLLLIPFLPGLIEGEPPAEIGLTKLYLIYLGNTALSYFLYAYMTSVIVVHQRDDVKSRVNSAVKIALTATQIAVLLITKNYYLFSLMMPVFTLVNNLWIGWRVHRLFPQYRPEGSLSTKDRQDIRRLVTGTFIQEACTVTRNSLDSICISGFLGLTLTGIYNNYYLILNGVTMFTGLVTAAFTGGIGNHVATKTVEENYAEMKKLDFVYLWLGGWCMICLICLYQPFMRLWMGEDMLLPTSAVVLLGLYFYLLKLGDIRSMYTSAYGLWWEQRYRAIGETSMNVVLNIVLGKLFGIHGIILATMISLFLCNYLWAAAITFRHYFTLAQLRDYYAYQGKQSAITFIVAAGVCLLCAKLPIQGDIALLMARACICVTIPNLVNIAVYHRTDAFRYAKQAIFRR
ncbi:MAG: hypothetical protein E7317_07500 [Clostridiales bacterium]|nr:hypothetical protein [Clostridiales bacterium]